MNEIPSASHEPPSYWHSTTPHMTLSVDLPSSADVVVIGGGIVGASTCYWLARAGRQVVLLERSAAAAGATGRNGGFVTIGPAMSYPRAIEQFGEETANAILRLTLENRLLVRQMVAEEHIACDYREPGHLHLALNEQQYREQAQSQVALQKASVTTHLLNRQQTQEYIATPLGSDIIGGMFTPGTALVNPAHLVAGILKAAHRRGARLVQANVTGFAPDNNSVRIETTRGTIHAHAAVVATNAWIPMLLPPFKSVITPVRGQVLAYAPTAPIFTAGMGADISGTGEYWQQTPDGTIVLGGCRAVAPDREIDKQVSQPTPEVQTALEAIFPRLFPALTQLQVRQRWAGLMAFTLDYLPVVDRVPELPAIWVAGGFSGHGMPFATRLGQLVASAVSGADTPELVPFRLNRPTLAQ